MKTVKKITYGFVIQEWEANTGKFVGQTFCAGDEVDWEDHNSCPIDPIDEFYHHFNMENEV